jgi:hypothetical protein
MTSCLRYLLPRQAQLATSMAVAMLFLGGALAADDRQAEFQAKIQPLLKKVCYDCHGERNPQADLILTKYHSPQQILEGRKVWLNAVQKLRDNEMPPDEAKAKLTKAERTLLIDWLTDATSDIDCRGSPEPGRVTLRRLTRYEYRNSVRDLTGIDYEPAKDFPADDTGYGFDNIGDVLSLPPILLEKYLTAAEEIASKAIVSTGATHLVDKRVYAQDMKYDGKAEILRTNGVKGITFTTNGAVTTSFHLPYGGEYEVRIQAAGDFAGDELPKIGLSVDGKPDRTIEVKHHRQEPKEIAFKRRFGKGTHKLGIAFINDFFDKDAPDPNKRDRNLILNYVQVEGPLDGPMTKLPESHEQLINAVPDDKLSPREASEKVLRRLASRAFRRPATPEEIERLVGLTEKVRAEGDTFEQGIQLALQAVLISPHFLYKVEMDPPGKEGQPRDLTEFEVATRLSYFLWNSSPDDELLMQGWKKTLLKGANLEQQVRRMLKDTRSKALVENFASQWLELRSLDVRTPDATTFPAYDAKLKLAMRRETELFVWTVLREDRSVIDLLSTDFTFVNGPLAKLYGIPGIEGEQFQRVATGNLHRGGLLTQASFLTVTSNPNRTSPVKRGKFILDNILGMPPPPPPPNVPELKEQELKGTLRERMEQHRTNPVCASCHQRMDPLGFALENYDGIGGWRDKEGGSKVDASGKLPSGESFNGPDELRQLLVARKDQFVECLAEKLLTYALGRGLEYYDQCAVDKIVKNVKAADYRFSSLVLEVVRSDPFLKKGAKRISQ